MEPHHTHDVSIIAEITLNYSVRVRPQDRPRVQSSQEAFALFSQAWDMNLIGFVEQFKVMLLNRANRLLNIYPLSTGGLTGTVADPRLLFVAALRAGATAVILAHNHPSGNMQPSTMDQQFTQRMIQGGRLLDITVTDHLIIQADDYYSFLDNGMML